jgi:3-methyladenine DNA glycosylase Tag
MQGQMTEENIYQLERLFENRDSIKIVRKQIERYERLVMEQTEKIERAIRNADEAERLQKEAESLRNGH